MIPDPLHPAIVHFPIVLLLAGGAAAVAAVFWRGGYLPWFAAALLVLGAAGAWGAVETGEDSGGLLEKLSPAMESIIDEHEVWAKRTMLVAIAAAAAAIGSALLTRRPKLARAVAITTAVLALAGCYTVYETGHRGGTLVYRHGAGVQVSLPAPAVVTGASGTVTKPAKVDRD